MPDRAGDASSDSRPFNQKDVEIDNKFLRVVGYGGPRMQLNKTESNNCHFTGASSGDKSCAPARIQLSVDDPAVSLAGTETAVKRSVDLLLLWWMALGAPWPWAKGAFTAGQHIWIGVKYQLTASGAYMELPPDYLDELATMLKPFAEGKGHVDTRMAHNVACKASRLSAIVPWAGPFVGAFWGALKGAANAASRGDREAPPGRMASRRFASAAMWLRDLISGSKGLAPLRRIVRPFPDGSRPSGDVAIFDASPWGAERFGFETAWSTSSSL